MNLDDLEVKINKPYPKIVGAYDDKMTVGILKNLATSRFGELGGVLQYIYQSVESDKSHEEIGQIFEEIAVVEMMHLDMLMHAITDFGGIPRYEDSQGNIFNTSMINYTQKLNEMLASNIADEKRAIEDYKMAIMKVKNDSLKNLLKRILEDEERHLEIFTYLKNSVNFMSI
ncbi:MAG: hypothetical protein E7374_01540 [Clostridiales bacterium]|nr:hypothetical protein [Clostridiales bacterium]